MNRLNRQFVKLRKRSADENDVGILLHDFNESDNLLTKVCNSFADNNREFWCLKSLDTNSMDIS